MGYAKRTLPLPKSSRPLVELWDGIVAIRPIIYICTILFVAVISLMYELRTRTILACQADGYNSDRYVAYCAGENYADYEHGAFYFGLEPPTQSYVYNADVLFLGNSRLQVAFSTDATARWFSSVAAHYYLLGFSYYENVIFAEALLHKIGSAARVYVINVDGFFDQNESPPAKTVLHDAEARPKYEIKRIWQRAHEAICKTAPMICGHRFVIYRSRETGAYHAYQTEGAVDRKEAPVSYDRSVDQDVVNSNAAAAIAFLAHFTEGKCVILTMIPSVGTKMGDAAAVANALGMDLITPEGLGRLQTFDGYHLDRASAERWSQAFFEVAGPKIRSCLEKQDLTHS